MINPFIDTSEDYGDVVPLDDLDVVVEREDTKKRTKNDDDWPKKRSKGCEFEDIEAAPRKPNPPPRVVPDVNILTKELFPISAENRTSEVAFVHLDAEVPREADPGRSIR